MKLIKISILLSALFICTIANAQSPWAKNKGEGYSQISFTTVPENNVLFQKDKIEINTERYIIDNTIQSYNEIGIVDDLSAIVILPYKMQSAGKLTDEEDLTNFTQEGSITGISNISLGVRKGFQLNDWVAAVQIKYDFKTRVYDNFSGLSTGYDCATINGLYSIGKGINDKNYFFAYTGGSFRTNNYSDVVNFGVEYGHQFLNQLWVIPYIDFVFSLQNGETTPDPNQGFTGLYVNNQEYTAAGLKLIEEINENIGITLGLGGAFTGHNVAQAPAISFGAYYKW